ncbi:MAG: hypothetical protein JXA78_17510 [Anaerolineales bacterium]|nr:hypothetical protein [Anaerolineales bacterium]
MRRSRTFSKSSTSPLELEVGGVVVEIAPQANTIGGDVVYTATIELDKQPEGLRWGMSVDVEIVTE